MLDLYEKIRFGTIKPEDRLLYFPPSKIIAPPKQSQNITRIEDQSTSSPIKSAQPMVTLRGLVNNGNMCFMNSILQPLVNLQPFQYIIDAQQPSSKEYLTTAMQQFISFFESGDSNPIDATFVYEAIRKKSGIDSAKGRQEDAQEFLGFLLDGLHEEFLILHPAKQEWHDVGKKNKTIPAIVEQSPISALFAGRLRTTSKPHGKPSTLSYEPFTILQLPLHNTILDAITSIASTEIIGDPPIFTRKTLFDTLPRILVLGIKRFIYDTKLGRVVKLLDYIKVDTNLTIPPMSIANSTPDGSNFELSAIVNHHGQSSLGGHYTCDVKSVDGWIRFDDASFSKVEEHDVIKESSDRQAYILVYVRV